MLTIIASSPYGDNSKMPLHNQKMASELWQRVLNIRLWADLTQQEVADACDISREAVSQWEAEDPEKRTRPKMKNMSTLLDLAAKKTNVRVSMDWLVSDKSSITELYRTAAAKVKADINVAVDTLEALTDLSEAMPRTHQPASNADTVPIPLMNATPSMGFGALRPEYDVVIRKLEMDRGFLRRLSITRPEALRMLTAYGDSMAPTFNDGDVLLVDTAVAELKIDSVYVLGRNTDEIMVKRIQRRMDGSVSILSDNPTYQPMIVPKEEVDQIQVLGRVVWAWNGKKL